jgi:glycosyltransferase involved in cell wall biosynthesis
MLTGHNLVYFGPEKWDGLWRNRHQLMSRFAQQNKVLYVEPYIDLQRVRHEWRAGSLKWNDLWQDFRKSRVRKQRDNLFIYRSPVFIPISGRYPLDRITWFMWKGWLKAAMRKLGMEKPIVWLSRPNMLELNTGFGAQLVVYHVVDEYAAYPGNDWEARRQQQALERQMLKKADLVVVVSENLLQSKRPFNKNTFLVPNGVDVQSYVQATESHRPPPPDITQLSRPVIGYSGLIAARLNLDLLEHIAITHPEWSIALVGAVDERYCAGELARLKQIRNIHFLGRKEIDQVPRYVQAFDVCLIPYQLDERAQNASPLKLYDYMATGKPVVATDFPAARQFSDLIYIAQTVKDFMHHIEQALAENDDDLAQKRQLVARENTWEKRVEQLSQVLESHLFDSEPIIGREI